MNEYNFDPMTGEPIEKPQETQSREAQPQEPQVQEIEMQESEMQEPEIQEPEIQEVQPQEAQPQEPEMQEAEKEMPQAQAYPTEENPVYHYARPKAEASFQREYSSAGGVGYDRPYTPPVKKEPKFVTQRALAIAVAITLIASLILGLGGGILAAKLLPGGATPTGTAVIYKTAKLQDADGDKQRNELTIPEVAELVKNSVVEITTEQIVTGSFMQQYVSEGAGSGVIFTKDGYIVTNHHVIDGATNIKVRLADGTEYTAKLLGSDAKSDLAVIKVEAADLTPAAFGKSAELKVGDTVVAVGNPLGELGGTVTRGIISALDRAITIDKVTMNLLQTDTAINPGNSGGGMFNTSGQLVGVVNAKSAGEEIEGLGFAIPIDTAAKVIEDLLELGYVSGRVSTGFTFVEIRDSMTAMMYRVNEMGLYISAVKKGSDGEKAGFKSGDYVVSVEGTIVTTEAEANAIIDTKSPGDTVKIEIKRNGEKQTIPLTLSEYVPAKEEQKTNGSNQQGNQQSNPLGGMFPFMN